MIAICPSKCKHEAQDEFHGKNRRVFNLSETKAEAHCTVCGTTLNLSATEMIKMKEKKDA